MSRYTNITTETVIIGTTAVGILTALTLYWYQRKNKRSSPTKWVPVGKVKNLYIYPLKSGHNIELDMAICTDYGIKMPKTGSSHQFIDRSLLVYKAVDNEFRTAKQYPNLIFVKTVPHPTEKDYFILNAPKMPEIKVKIPSLKDSKGSEIKLYYSEKIFTIDCGNEVAKWISQYILDSDSGLRVGFHDGLSQHRRNVTDSHKKYLKIYSGFGNEATGMYTDYTSYNIINEDSVKDLNEKLPDTQVTPSQFRPNILIEGAPAYAEDNWDWIKIGNDVIMYFSKPCTRCMFTNINPETAVRSEIDEPLKTLRSYRLLKDIKDNQLEGHLPVMGIHTGLQKGGVISVGDTVYVGKD